MELSTWDAMLRKTADDARLSSGERKTVRERLREAALDDRVRALLRSHAYELARPGGPGLARGGEQAPDRLRLRPGEEAIDQADQRERGRAEDGLDLGPQVAERGARHRDVEVEQVAEEPGHRSGIITGRRPEFKGA